MGECIQGLVLFGNQWLLFAELGGFVNNAWVFFFFVSLSVCLLASVPSQFLFVFLFCCLSMVCLRIGCNQAHYRVPTSV